MLKKILLIPMLLVSFAIADNYNSETQTENKILKLKLEIYKLKEKNSSLQKIINGFNLKLKDKIKENDRRERAIIQLKRDLRNSRLNKSPQVMLLR